MKIIKWFDSQSLFVFTLFFLSFVPLYPKIPVVGFKTIWVYVRLEDFLVVSIVLLYILQLFRKKATLKTSLTIPIFLFWIINGIGTLYAVLFIFPKIANVSAINAALFYVRHIEYIIVFFIAYSAFFVKTDDKRDTLFFYFSTLLKIIFSAIAAAYIIYFSADILLSSQNVQSANPFIAGAKFAVFCASYILLSLIWFKKRIQSLIAVLVFTVIAVVAYGAGQRYFAFPAYLTGNEEFAKGIPLRISALGRIASTFAGHYDLAAYLVMLIPILGSMVIGFKKWWVKGMLLLTATFALLLLLMTASRTSFAVYLLAVSFMLILQKKKWFIFPVIIASILLLQGFQGISQRFSSTISQVDVVVDARTGKAIGIATQDRQKIVIRDIQQTGESLPQGSSYINLPGQEAKKTTLITRKNIKPGTNNVQVTSMAGDFAIKKVLAYDISFTTRFQGEWPRAMEAFKRNYLFGSGYSSISLATDGNYMRLLGETGVLGFLSFGFIFLFFGIYAYRVLPDVRSKTAKSFIIGVIAAIFGLALNAVLIDVFEASKVAFVLWMLVGISVGILHQYNKKKINYAADILAVVTSVPAIIIYILLITFLVYSMMFGNYFVGDDFTWLRGIADCNKAVNGSGNTSSCGSLGKVALQFFTNSNSFFYMPAAKIYFLIMYTLFWLNAAAYHILSTFFHFITASCVFFLTYRIFRNKLLGVIGAVFFVVLSGNYESLFWISSVGYIAATMFILLGLVFFALWRQTKNIFYIIASIVFIAIAPFFQEIGITGPFLLSAYAVIIEGKFKRVTKFLSLLLYFIPVPFYFYFRNKAQSQWFAGDYSYRLSNLPFNAIGNLFGYFFLAFFGVGVIPYYNSLRNYGKNNVTVVIGIIFVLIAVLGFIIRHLYKRKTQLHERILFFSISYSVIALLPVLGLGNMTSRYLYIASFGIVLFFVYVLYLIFLAVKRVSKVGAYIVLIFIAVSFTVFQIFELQRVNKDWQQAGLITYNLQTGFNSFYANGKTGITNPVFYFVDTPIRYKTAWVFPAGLPDALWFTFQDQNLTVRQVKNLEEAFSQADASSSARIFQFGQDGSVVEVEKK